jgi:hypothetical protein
MTPFQRAKLAVLIRLNVDGDMEWTLMIDPNCATVT